MHRSSRWVLSHIRLNRVLRKLIRVRHVLATTPASALSYHQRLFGVLLAAIVLSGALTGCEQHPSVLGDFQAAHKTSVDASRPRYWLGVLNGVKIRIPEYYLFPKKIIYKGESHDGLGPASEGATSESRILDFGILLRLSDLQPIRAEQDQREWESAFSTMQFQKTWMMVDFDNLYPVVRNPNPGHYMLPRFGPFDQDKNLVYGLVHFESDQTVEDGMRGSNSYGHVEYFFDLPNLTVIECETHKMRVPPFALHDYCQHTFFIPELNVSAKAFYTKKDLPRWRELEERVRGIAHTFIVGSSTVK